MTEKHRRTATEWLLTYLGPAEVGNIRGRRRALTAAERARDAQLRHEFVRVVGFDGRAFLVERDASPDARS
ncbi:hypothetical protein [Cellulomonas sp. URHD0024]|uniref:hypothetical protein n=1 Tax=Cellulomonas sp. URHD0024 TaxID=1302620 RepID=UPI00042A8682|nr:hypothetical protein [Cellulomonas sp. URHD0024]